MRSQDKEALIKIENISIDSENYIIGNLISDDNKSICDYWRLGHYKAKERALEVLDEISSKIKNRYIVSTTTALISKDEMAKEYKRLNYLYSGESIMENPSFEIKPINNDVIYYEMPKE